MCISRSSKQVRKTQVETPKWQMGGFAHVTPVPQPGEKGGKCSEACSDSECVWGFFLDCLGPLGQALCGLGVWLPYLALAFKGGGTGNRRIAFLHVRGSDSSATESSNLISNDFGNNGNFHWILNNYAIQCLVQSIKERAAIVLQTIKSVEMSLPKDAINSAHKSIPLVNFASHKFLHYLPGAGKGLRSSPFYYCCMPDHISYNLWQACKR